MATSSRLLTATEQLDIYQPPVLNEAERREHFTLSAAEKQALASFRRIEDAVYFAISLVFFKLKHTLVTFHYRETTPLRQHVMQRYFPNRTAPKSLPKHPRQLTRIETQVLALCSYQRFTGKVADTIQSEILRSASCYPRQRQLCKALLDLLVQHRVAIPAYGVLQESVSRCWNQAQQQLVQAYLRHTKKLQRDQILALLDKSGSTHTIISIKQDMKGFNTAKIRKELDKHRQLKPIFTIAETVIPVLRLPMGTVNYYANLIHYYNGPRLKQLQTHTAQLYLLCYGYTRYLWLNDLLLDALKKRTNDYREKANQYAKEQALKQLATIQEARQRVSDLLIAIQQHRHAKQIPRSLIYQHIPEDELLTSD